MITAVSNLPSAALARTSWAIGAFVLLLVSASAGAQTSQGNAAACPGASAKPPLMTYDENVQYLGNPECQTSFLDAIQFIPLGQSENRYLSVGFWIRERGEYFSNPNWSDTPSGNAYAGVVFLSLVLWVTGGAYVGAATVASIAVCLILITRVLTWNDIAEHKRAWTTFAWLGALIALCDGLNRVGFVKWFADGIATHMRGFSPHLAMIILLALFFVAHYVFASVDAYTTALLPLILLTGAAIPGIPVKEIRLALCMELGIMGVITPFPDAASPVYANSGYLPTKDYWRLGTVFGAIFLIVFLSTGVLWASLLSGKLVLS